MSMEQEEKTDKDNATEVGNMFIYFLYCTSLCSYECACSVADADPDTAGSISFCQIQNQNFHGGNRYWIRHYVLLSNIWVFKIHFLTPLTNTTLGGMAYDASNNTVMF